MSTLRRGRPTVNSEWNNPSSVLVGDFMYSRAFQILVKLDNMRIMEIIADTTNKIAEGEVLQLINKHNPEASESNYMNVIRSKTAILFQAAAHCGGILANADDQLQDSLKHYGMHLGMAFQLVDDALDYDGDSENMGKNIGDDLAEGKPTLPLIYAMGHGNPDQTHLIEESLKEDSLPIESLSRIIEIVQQTGALDYTRKIAEVESRKALDCLEHIPHSDYRDTMATLARFAIDRSA
jgi:octaprenyl-diphosphate synthase